MTLARIRDARFAPRLAALTALAAGLRLYRLADTPPSADGEVVASAFDFVARGHYGETMWQHPKLRDLLTAASIRGLGGGMWGLKLPSLLMGTISVILVALLARRLFRSDAIALLAALFLAIDPVHVDFSRQAIQEVHVPFFSLLGILAGLAYAAHRRMLLAVAAGILFGLGLAAKWHALFPLLVVLAGLGARTLRDEGASRREKAEELAFLSAALLLLPATVYLATYLPWFMHRGYDLGDWIAAQRWMARENAVHQGFKEYLMEYDSYPVLWFVKPVVWADFALTGSGPFVLLAISNPLVWLLTLPAAAALLRVAIREKDRNAIFLSALFWCSYLPLVAAGRPIWVNSSPAVTPLAFVIVAWGVVSALRGAARPRLLLSGYLAGVLVVAAPLYLLAIGNGLHDPMLGRIVEQFRPANER